MQRRYKFVHKFLCILAIVLFINLMPTNVFAQSSSEAKQIEKEEIVEVKDEIIDPKENLDLNLVDENEIIIDEQEKDQDIEEEMEIDQNTPKSLSSETEVESFVTDQVELDDIAKTDLQSGAFTFNHSISLPQGINGLNPSLNLSYNSNNRYNNSILGYGWDINIPFIERVNRYGVNELYNSDKAVFYSSNHGELKPVDIISDSSGSYQPEIENGIYNEYTYNSDNSWVFIDSSGTTFVYGEIANHRQDDPDDDNRVFKWMLSSITDSNGNSINYDYVKNQGEIYPNSINYAPYRVTFDLEVRPDQNTSFASAFKVTTSNRVSQINSFFQEQPIAENQIDYITSNANRSLIQSVQYLGYDDSGNTFLDEPVIIEYGIAEDEGFEKDLDFEYPRYTEDGVERWVDTISDSRDHLLDINGDGLVDILIQPWHLTSTQDPNDPDTKVGVYINTGEGFEKDLDFEYPTYMYDGDEKWVDTISDSRDHLLDVNGDGLVDMLIQPWSNAEYRDPSDPDTKEGLYINTGEGFEKDLDFEYPRYTEDGVERWVDTISDSRDHLLDVNGDGLVDMLIQPWSNAEYRDPSDPDTKEGLYINTGEGFEKDLDFEYPRYTEDGVERWVDTISDSRDHLLDINGDGLVDILIQPWHLTSTQDPNDPDTKVGVYINTGEGFEKDLDFEYPRYTEDGVERWVDTISDSRDHLLDVNGDGLVDMLIQPWSNAEYRDPSDPDTKEGLYINTGEGFEKDLDFEYPRYTEDGVERWVDTISDSRDHLLDINGDGLVDILIQPWHLTSTQDPNDPDTKVGVYINTGEGFEKDLDFEYPRYTEDGVERWVYKDSRRRDHLIDISGDGQTDFVIQPWHLTSTQDPNAPDTKVGLYINTGENNLLTKVRLSSKGIIEPTYKLLDNFGQNRNIPDKLTVVNDVTYRNGIGNEWTHTFEFHNPYNYFKNSHERKFTGFQKAVQVNGVGNKSITYIHQGNENDSSTFESNDHIHLAGKVYRTELYDNDDNLYQTSITKWARDDLGNGVSFARPYEEVNMIYDGLSAHTDKAITYTYDVANGSTVQEKNWGFVRANVDGSFTDTKSDIVIHEYEYASNGTVIQPSQFALKNVKGGILRLTQHLYDELPLGEISLGNKTMERQLINNTKYAEFQNTYDSYGNMLTSTDARGKTTYYEYDEYNLFPELVRTSAPFSYETITNYNYLNQKPSLVTNPNGDNLIYIYDELGRIKEVYQEGHGPDEQLLQEYTYNKTTLPLTTTQTTYHSSDPIISTTYYDGFTKTVHSNTAGYGSDTTYYNDGNVQTTSLPYMTPGYGSRAPAGLITTYTYDPLNRVLNETNIFGTDSYTYNGSKTTIRDKQGRTNKIFVDARENVIQIRDAYNGATRYAYNLANDLLAVVDADGYRRQFKYDKLGRKTQTHLPKNESAQKYMYAYDKQGNLTKVTKPDGNIITYNYDNLNRVKTEKLNDTVQATYTYDDCTNGFNRLCSTQTNETVTYYSYTPHGLISAFSREFRSYDQSLTSSTIYDIQGNPLQVNYSTGDSITYSYNNRGLVENVTSSREGLIASLEYSPHGAVSNVDYGNGASSQYTYEPSHAYRLAEHTTLGSEGTLLQDYEYTYDNIGNITGINNISGHLEESATYVYDKLDRLTKTTIVNPLGSSIYDYSYSRSGNILTSPAGLYQYTDPSHPHAVTNIGTDLTFSYDLNGNQVRKDDTNYRYDHNNRQIQANLASGINLLYDYDHAGVRTLNHQTGLDTPKTIFTLDDNFEHIKSEEGDMQVITIQAPSMRLASLKVSDSGSELSYQHLDHLGSTTLSTNSDLEVTETTRYTPFGSIVETTGSNDTHKKFTGHEYDSATDLSYMKARYYDGQTGRFNAQDPMVMNLGSPTFEQAFGFSQESVLLNPQSLNPYSYVNNNPINAHDPTGMYDIKTGEVQKGDTKKSILETINKEFGTNAKWKDIKRASFYKSEFGNKKVHEIVGQSLRIGTDYTTDVTDELNNLMIQADSEIKESVFAFLQVAPDGPWDLKNLKDGLWGVDSDDKRVYWSYVYNENLIRYDAPGNILYGYAARSAGLIKPFIWTGATITQIATDKKIKLDNGGDWKYIKKGIKIYNKQ
jgi:RHS repeat-associated protein